MDLRDVGQRRPSPAIEDSLRSAELQSLHRFTLWPVSERLDHFSPPVAFRHGLSRGIHIGTFLRYSAYSAPNLFTNPGSSDALK